LSSALDKSTKSKPYTNNNNLNTNNKPNQIEKHLQVFQEIITEEKKEFNNAINTNSFLNLKAPITNKDSLDNMYITNFNKSSIRNEIPNHSIKANCMLKQEETFNNNFLIMQDNKVKMPYNRLLPNINKFEKIYQNYKEQEKSVKELKGNQEVDAKTYFANMENNKIYNLNIKVINS